MAQQKVVILLQEGITPQPIDYRDVVLSYSRPDDIPAVIDAPVRTMYDRLQSTAGRDAKQGKQSLLEEVDLGDLAAENEIIGLESYFVPTGQANTARHGRARLVVGRKGSGKTAIFYKVREDVFRRRTHLVLDLKPEGHQFKELRENVMDRLGRASLNTPWSLSGTTPLAQLARTIIDDWPHARHDPDLIGPYTRVEEVYERHNPGFQADFSQRLLWEANRLAERVGDIPIDQLGPQLTELIFSGDVRDQRGGY